MKSLLINLQGKDAPSRTNSVYLIVIESLSCNVTVWGNGNIGPFGQTLIFLSHY